jgi:hypothetical protein
MSEVKREDSVGGPYGTPFGYDYSAESLKRLVSIQIWTRNDEISAISFTYQDENDQQYPKGPFGRTAGATAVPEVRIYIGRLCACAHVNILFLTYYVHMYIWAQMKFGTGEAVTLLSGSYNAEHITLLRVKTNLRDFPAYGKMSDNNFNFNKGSIVAFLGRSSANHLNAIGTYYLDN